MLFLMIYKKVKKMFSACLSIQVNNLNSALTTMMYLSFYWTSVYKGTSDVVNFAFYIILIYYNSFKFDSC